VIDLGKAKFKKASRGNISFLFPLAQEFIPRNLRLETQEEDPDFDSSDDDIYCSPMFSSGSVVTPVMLEGILSSSFQQPALAKTIQAFCGSCWMQADNEKIQTSLFTISVPPEMFNCTFGNVFSYLAIEQDKIALAILRAERDPQMKNSKPYVITNPLWSFIIRPSDTIYVVGRS
jgi:hypothetical protein